ncbi:MAG: hypothetical protein PHW02_08385, partial [bacterium]|nr:hypothetical protein [bacterium]
MNILKNRFSAVSLTLVVLYFGVTAVMAILLNKPAIMLYFAVYLFLMSFMLFSNKTVSLLVFLSFYGIVNRMIFFFTGGFAYSLLFPIPLFVFLSNIDDSSDRAKRLSPSSAQISILYIVLTLYSAAMGASSSILSSSVAAAAYISPLLLASAIRIERGDIERTLLIVIPAGVFLFALQFFGIYFPFDRYYISKVSSYDFTSLLLGSHNRPFSTFSSPEELSAFLSFSAFFSVFSKRDIMKVFAIASLISLLLLSARSAIFILLLAGIFFMARKRMVMQIAILASLGIMCVISANVFVKDYTIYRTDPKGVAIVKHTLEPFRNPLGSYSMVKRTESLKNLASDIRKNPFGTGLSHAETLTKSSKDEYPSESSAIKLVKSGGIFFLALVIVLSIYSIGRAFRSEDSDKGALIIFFLSLFLFMNGMTMHLMSFILSGTLFLS